MPNSPNFPDFPSPDFPNLPAHPNLTIQPIKKTDISFDLGIIPEISDFGFTPKIGLMVFQFFVLCNLFEIIFENNFYSTANFFVKSVIFFAPTFLVIHSYFLLAHPNICLNAPPRRSRIETLGAPE